MTSWMGTGLRGCDTLDFRFMGEGVMPYCVKICVVRFHWWWVVSGSFQFHFVIKMFVIIRLENCHKLCLCRGPCHTCLFVLIPQAHRYLGIFIPNCRIVSHCAAIEPAMGSRPLSRTPTEPNRLSLTKKPSGKSRSGSTDQLQSVGQTVSGSVSGIKLKLSDTTQV